MLLDLRERIVCLWTMALNNNLPTILWCPIAQLLSRSILNYVARVLSGDTHLRVRADCKITAAEVAPAPERVYWSAVVHANLPLLCIVAHTLTDMLMTCPTVSNRRTTKY